MPNSPSLLSWLAQNTQKEKDEKKNEPESTENAISFESSFVCSVNGEEKEKKKRIERGSEGNEQIKHPPGCTQAQPVTIAYGFPACPHCACTWITEHTDAQGVYLRCWSCRSNIPKQILDNRIRINAATSTEQRRLLPW